MVLLVATTSLKVNAETADEEEESYNNGILSKDDLPNMEFDFGSGADAVAGTSPGTVVPGFKDEVNDIPIDGGISILLGAGLAYGAARLRKKKEENDLFI